jgi:hypothetical protein
MERGQIEAATKTRAALIILALCAVAAVFFVVMRIPGG